MMIAILIGFDLIILYCLCRDKQDVSFNAKDAANMVTPKTLKKKKERIDKLFKEQNEEDERHYKMLKKLIAKEAKTGSTSLYYNESWVFNDVISYRVLDRLTAEGFTITKNEYSYTVRNGFGNSWKEKEFGFWIKW